MKETGLNSRKRQRKDGNSVTAGFRPLDSLTEISQRAKGFLFYEILKSKEGSAYDSFNDQTMTKFKNFSMHKSVGLNQWDAAQIIDLFFKREEKIIC